MMFMQQLLRVGNLGFIHVTRACYTAIEEDHTELAYFHLLSYLVNMGSGSLAGAKADVLGQLHSKVSKQLAHHRILRVSRENCVPQGLGR